MALGLCIKSASFDARICDGWGQWAVGLTGPKHPNYWWSIPVTRYS